MSDSIYETIGRNYVRREFMRRQHDAMCRKLVTALMDATEDTTVGELRNDYYRKSAVNEPSEDDLLKFAQTIR